MTRSRRLRALTLALATAVFTPLACSDAPTGPGNNGTGGDDYAHDRAPGASANDLLAADEFEHLIVQVQYVEGYAPTPEGLEYLEAFLSARANKPGGVEIRVDGSIASPGTEAYTASDVRALEEEHRTLFTHGDTLAAYLLYLDARYEQENVLGIAYNNTSTALFAEVIDQNTGGALQPRREVVEGTVANHEFGHLFGLVDNGSDMQTPHRDEEHGNHCDNESCLMYYAVRTTGFLENLIGGEPPGLDQNCLDDLQSNGGK